jgi:methanogenic corrinoid protein MtbC1
MDTVNTSSFSKEEIAHQALEVFYQRNPAYHQKYGERGREKAYEDWLFHLSYLSSAVSANEPNLFVDYLAWCKMLFRSLNFPEQHFIESIEILHEIFKDDRTDTGRKMSEYLEIGLGKFTELPSEINSFMHQDSELGVLAQQYLNSLLRRDRETAANLIFDAIEGGTSIRDIYLKVFQPALYEVGRLWHLNKLNVAMEHYCTAATQLIISRLYPYIFTGVKGTKKLVATSVSGELHELGVRMITDFFELEGWDTYYLGANTPHDSVVSTVEELDADLLAISATIPFHIEKVAELIASVRKNKAISHAKILVGGYPFNQNQDLWHKVGADGTASDARMAVQVAAQL